MLGVALVSLSFGAVGPAGAWQSETDKADEAEGAPERMVELYQWAADGASCSIQWTTLAGLAAVASDHGRFGDAEIDAGGVVSPDIVGLPLDGQDGRRLIVDSDNGVLDGDTTYDRAIGPFQFIPATWIVVAVDGNGDGVLDPHNIWDAAASAARLLCLDGQGDVDVVEMWFGSSQFTPLVNDGADLVRATTSIRRAAGVATELAQLFVSAEGPEIAVLGSTQVQDENDGDGDGAVIQTSVSVSSSAPTATGSLTMVADWDGDGNDEAVLAENLIEGVPLDGLQSMPIIGDWNGDGADDAGVYDDGVFHLFLDGDVRRIELGEPGALAFAGDWTGDGFDGVAVANPIDDDGDDIADRVTFEFAASGFGIGRAGDRFGTSFTIPAGHDLLVTDLDGDGIDTPAVVVWGSDKLTVVSYDRWGAVVSTEELVADDIPSAQLVAGNWPRAETPSLTFSISASASYWQDVVVADGTVRSLWWVGGIYPISVDESIVDQTEAMLSAAAAEGIILQGWGWRSFERQIELRAAHCADIWETPASQCSPPTAKPGTSRHEFGVAIDFHDGASAIGSGSPEFQWLSDNAADFGFFNLPSEPWHWSIDGG